MGLRVVGVLACVSAHGPGSRLCDRSDAAEVAPVHTLMKNTCLPDLNATLAALALRFDLDPLGSDLKLLEFVVDTSEASKPSASVTESAAHVVVRECKERKARPAVNSLQQTLELGTGSIDFDAINQTDDLTNCTLQIAICNLEGLEFVLNGTLVNGSLNDIAPCDHADEVVILQHVVPLLRAYFTIILDEKASQKLILDLLRIDAHKARVMEFLETMGTAGDMVKAHIAFLPSAEEIVTQPESLRSDLTSRIATIVEGWRRHPGALRRLDPLGIVLAGVGAAFVLDIVGELIKQHPNFKCGFLWC